MIANTADVDMDVINAYRVKERKSLVRLDIEATERSGAAIIADDIIRVEDGVIRHDELKTAYLVFSYLMNGNSPLK